MKDVSNCKYDGECEQKFMERFMYKLQSKRSGKYKQLILG